MQLGFQSFLLKCPALLLKKGINERLRIFQAEGGGRKHTELRMIRPLLSVAHECRAAGLIGFARAISSPSVILCTGIFPYLFSRFFWSNSLLECWRNSAGCGSYSSRSDLRRKSRSAAGSGISYLNAQICAIVFMISSFRSTGQVILNAGVAVMAREISEMA